MSNMKNTIPNAGQPIITQQQQPWHAKFKLHTKWKGKSGAVYKVIYNDGAQVLVEVLKKGMRDLTVGNERTITAYAAPQLSPLCWTEDYPVGSKGKCTQKGHIHEGEEYEVIDNNLVSKYYPYNYITIRFETVSYYNFINKYTAERLLSPYKDNFDKLDIEEQLDALIIGDII